MIPPAELVIEILLPALRLDSEYPEPLPIRSWPFAGVEPIAVPPAAIGRMPVVSAVVLVAYSARLAVNGADPLSPVPPCEVERSGVVPEEVLKALTVYQVVVLIAKNSSAALT